MSQPKTFAERFQEVRRSKLKPNGRPMSHYDVAVLFNVHPATVSGWEHSRQLPDSRSREAIEKGWPEVFANA